MVPFLAYVVEIDLRGYDALGLGRDKMAGSLFSKWAVLSIGIVFHFSYLMSIFDIYFVSPLVHGMRHFNPETRDPATRLFLIVGDGLRADKALQPVLHPSSGEIEVLAPYLVGKATSNPHGVSHTRMPTESRPGHVALIAGFYEDVSAVTKGWQSNPVNFDSVFNQSRHTWSYGSPDILPMFSDGAEPGRVEMECYDHTYEDFTRSSIELDAYVFDKMDALFEAARHNATLNAQLRENKVVFFLHLLGIDTAGHSYRPYSAEYYDNVKYIDTKIGELEQKVNAFYGDKNSAWVFTADHGMSDFGSHGDGHPNNTRTPFITWGKGLRSEPVEADINQADIATLMSYLVGINYPANSVGELPLAYLDASPADKAHALAANAYSIVEQYLVKQSRVAASQLGFKPYPPLSRNRTVELRTQHIEAALAANNFDEAIKEAEDLMVEGLKGLKYLQKYNWLLLRSLVTLGFLGWIAYALTSFLYLFVVDETTKQQPLGSWITALAVAIMAGLASLLRLQQSPWHYYLYAFFPVFFWHCVLRQFATLRQGLERLVNAHDTYSGSDSSSDSGSGSSSSSGSGSGSSSGSSSSSHSGPISRLRQWIGALLNLALIEVMVQGYFRRELYSILLLVVYAPWPYIANWRTAMRHWRWTLLWTLSCMALSVFTLLPVVKTESLEQVVGAGTVMAILSFGYAVYLSRELNLTGTTMVTCGIQLSLIILATIVTRTSILSLQARQGLPIGSQLVGWMTLGFSLAAPFMHSLSPVNDYRFRMLSIFMVFSPTMVILSISYEAYFYVAFSLALMAWTELEAVLAPTRQRGMRLGHFRMAVTFMFLTHIGFFGTGNIASISSFSLESVYRLIPIFSPFAMGALLIFKILVPFVVLSVCLGIINMKVRLPKYALFSMVLAVSDLLSLNFFYLVQDEGSWLDIGTSISHYCICSMLCLFIILLEYLSTLLVSGVVVSTPSSKATGTEKVPNAAEKILSES